MKIRVWKKRDGGVVYNHLPDSHGFKPEEYPLPKASWVNDTVGYFIVDDSDLVKLAEGEYFEQLYLEGEEISIANLKKDTSWENMLMPDFLVKRKYLSHLKQKIDDEINKQTPDVVVLTKLNCEIDNCLRNSSELFWAEKAIEGLTRVAPGKNTTIIREKLNKKIEALK